MYIYTYIYIGKFDAVLSRHSGGQNQIAAKGAIILRFVIVYGHFIAYCN
jgi:hypothetical protein